MPEPSISVLLVDDHALVRRGFRRMLEDRALEHQANQRPGVLYGDGQQQLRPP